MSGYRPVEGKYLHFVKVVGRPYILVSDTAYKGDGTVHVPTHTTIHVPTQFGNTIPVGLTNAVTYHVVNDSLRGTLYEYYYVTR